MEDRVRILICLVQAESIMVANMLAFPLASGFDKKPTSGKSHSKKSSEKDLEVLYKDLVRTNIEGFKDTVPEQNLVCLFVVFSLEDIVSMSFLTFRYFSRSGLV